MKPWIRGLGIAGGYLLALGAAGALVVLRYRWVRPADVAASSGMYAFGDLLWMLVLGGLFSLVPTWFLLRALARAEGFWTFLASAWLPWAGFAPLSAVVWLLSLRGGAGPGPSVHPLLALGGAMAFLRILVAPASLAGAALAWGTCAFPAMRRRFLRAMALEACGLLALGIWVGRAVLSRC